MVVIVWRGVMHENNQFVSYVQICNANTTSYSVIFQW